MTTTMTLNMMNVRPGDPAFLVSTNLCDWFEIGIKLGDQHWLEAEIVGGGPDVEFLFNGRLFLPGSAGAGTIIDNFPKGPSPDGWTKRPLAGADGYELVSDDITLFGYEVMPGCICKVTVNIYSPNGSLVAESNGDAFLVHQGPVKIGRGGIFIG